MRGQIRLAMERETTPHNVLVEDAPRRPLDQVPLEQRPKFWMDEITGQLKPVVETYYRGGPLGDIGCALMRAYLQQWIESPVWDLPPVEPWYRRELGKLRKAVRNLKTAAEIREWLIAADTLGIEPL